MFSICLQFSLRCVGFTWFVLLRLIIWFFIVHFLLYCFILGTIIVDVVAVIVVYFVFPSH
jgi:hypothetical protein